MTDLIFLNPDTGCCYSLAKIKGKIHLYLLSLNLYLNLIYTYFYC